MRTACPSRLHSRPSYAPDSHEAGGDDEVERNQGHRRWARLRRHSCGRCRHPAASRRPSDERARLLRRQRGRAGRCLAGCRVWLRGPERIRQQAPGRYRRRLGRQSYGPVHGRYRCVPHRRLRAGANLEASLSTGAVRPLSVEPSAPSSLPLGASKGRYQTRTSICVFAQTDYESVRVNQGTERSDPPGAAAYRAFGKRPGLPDRGDARKDCAGPQRGPRRPVIGRRTIGQDLLQRRFQWSLAQLVQTPGPEAHAARSAAGGNHRRDCERTTSVRNKCSARRSAKDVTFRRATPYGRARKYDLYYVPTRPAMGSPFDKSREHSSTNQRF